MDVLISFSTDFRPVAWSTGLCPHCRQEMPLRIEKVLEVTSLWFIPVSRAERGWIARCGLCERHLQELPGVAVPLLEWSPANGIDALYDKLNVPLTNRPASELGDASVHSLLSAVEEAASIRHMNTAPGIVAGLIAGIVLGLIAGLAIHDHGIVQARLDRFGFAFAGILAGALIGAITGSALWVLWMRGRKARRRLEQVVRDYPLELTRLERLSLEHGRLIQKYVANLRLRSMETFTPEPDQARKDAASNADGR